MFMGVYVSVSVCVNIYIYITGVRVFSRKYEDWKGLCKLSRARMFCTEPERVKRGYLRSGNTR